MKRLALLLLLLAPSAHAAFTFRDGWVKVVVRTSSPNQVSCGTECERLWTYSYGVLLHLPAANVDSISGPGIQSKNVVTEPFTFLGFPIDPRIGIPPTIPASHRMTSYPPGKYGAYIIQFIGPADSGMIDGVRAAGAVLETYYGPLVHVITATPESFENIRALPYVQFADFSIRS